MIKKWKTIGEYKYHPEDVLGQGACGTVYKGLAEPSNQPVAIKVLSKKLMEGDCLREAYITEMHIMKKLRSDYIVEFISVIETDNNFYIVQEFCDGGDLRFQLQKQKLLPQKETQKYVKDILNGFMELINNGVIHRDLKPQNILINKGRAKIADFGHSKTVLSRSQMNKTLVGTPLYMSLELLRQEKYTSKCDIWALGITIYEMLFGDFPWKGETEFQLVNNLLKKPLQFSQKTQVSAKAKSFIEGCLKIYEKDRFSWIDVYSHPWFEGSFKNFVLDFDRQERRTKEILAQMRLAVHAMNLDFESLFTSMKLDRDSRLGKEEFRALMSKIQCFNCGEEEFQFLCRRFDTMGDGTVSFDDFKKSLSENGIRLSSIKHKHSVKQSNDGKQVVAAEPQVNSKVIETANKVKAKIKTHNLDLETVYKSYSKSKQHDMKVELFNKFMLKIDPKLTENDLAECFSFFDYNGDGKITYDDFQNTINKKCK